jgi:hypothetical protein
MPRRKGMKAKGNKVKRSKEGEPFFPYLTHPLMKMFQLLQVCIMLFVMSMRKILS